MKPIYPFAFLGALLAVGAVNAATTTPVGYTVTQCPPNSDTIVGLPLRISAEAAGVLTAAPSSTTGTPTLTSSSSAFGSVANTHYVKFKSGASDGKWYPITANTDTTLTIDLNGDSLGAVSGDSFEVLKFWTLAELFDPSTATSDAATTPHAIVASTNTVASGRRTELLIPDVSGNGINLAPSTVYYVHGGVWKKAGSGNTSFNDDQLWPDTYFIVRHPAAVTQATTYTAVGEVEVNKFSVPFATQAAARQDNFVALPRPVDLTLNELGLAESGAFLESTNTVASGRRDELLVFDNEAAARNKAPTAIYYRHAGIWKKAGAGNTDAGGDLIKGGFGFIVRKYQSGDGATQFWNNSPNY